MGELRRDPFTGNWVIVAPGRAFRPRAAAEAPSSQPSHRPCPFCPGHESETPPELWRAGGTNGDWRVRVFPNKFPALVNGHPQTEPRNGRSGNGAASGNGGGHGDLTGNGGAPRAALPGLESMEATGWHEVIVEHPDHHWDLKDASREEARILLGAYRARHRAVRDLGAASIVVFRNHGVASGNSMDHPHSQLMATRIVPDLIRRRLDAAKGHAGASGTSLFAEILDQELADGRRMVASSPRLVAFHPFASAAPYETWIVPRADAAVFAEADDATLDDLAGILLDVLRALDGVLGDPAYNLVLNGAPCGHEQHMRWHVQIVPRLTVHAGFELATGVAINPALPEETAAALRDSIERS